ncbi:hypothetical protein [Paenibacillus sp. y28]|uniref:hypothetical protein n=1 Tax=Paenibacillus sp. y28 TaxID=3129110 RepID=UPI0030169575
MRPYRAPGAARRTKRAAIANGNLADAGLLSPDRQPGYVYRFKTDCRMYRSLSFLFLQDRLLTAAAPGQEMKLIGPK